MLVAATLASPAIAQLLPQVGQAVGSVTEQVNGTVNGVLDRTGLDLDAATRPVRDLARDRIERLNEFIRANRQSIEPDDQGQPARRGVVLLVDPDTASLAAAQRLGYRAGETQTLGSLGISAIELDVPQGTSLASALKSLRKALPGKTLTADPIHFPSAEAQANGKAPARPAVPAINTPVGLIDGGVGSSVNVRAQQGFAPGAPSPSDHGTAIASLMRDAGVTNVMVADVYGRDPAGGSALSIARALDWMVGQRVQVVSISLVGPRNPLLERAIAAAGTRGTTIVAAVGNDGPAAPPAFPASYPAVLAVTGVDLKDRAMIEAGRSLHLDYAAPGAGIFALNARGEDKRVRGTSFAAPLVAARAAAAVGSGANVRAALDREARDLGKKGPDDMFGRGLVCGTCARR
ncbi:MAG: S8 family serine peptidase [Sphingobium sp.]|nr:S8 family serine peptidase [Sphingobium sp.]